jgi:hypothetical protein
LEKAFLAAYSYQFAGVPTENKFLFHSMVKLRFVYT